MFPYMFLILVVLVSLWMYVPPIICFIWGHNTYEKYAGMWACGRCDAEYNAVKDKK